MNTGIDDKKIHKSDVAANIGCVVLLALFVAWGFVLYHGIQKSMNRGTIDMRAGITYEDGIVTLINKENLDWRYVYFSLDTDDNPENYEYSYYVSKIKAKETVTIDLADFTRSNIENFDPVTMQPKNLSIFGQTTSGVGHFMYSW
jgi:hypothetical protein